jgi:hypothetical protein
MVLEDGMNGSTKNPLPLSMDDLDLEDTFFQTGVDIFIHRGSGIFWGKGMKI